MKPLEILGRARTPDGQELVLYHRDDDYQIRLGGFELMSSHAHGSEEELARRACSLVEGERPRVLIGGLGLGYTLRAALDALPQRAKVEVAEVLPAVVEWNRGPLAHLAGHPLEDRRVRVRVADVVVLLQQEDRERDVILLDVDNGPHGLSLDSNRRLYSDRGLGRLRGALAPGGVLGIWSPDFDRTFLRRLRRAGLDTESVDVPARPGRSRPRHTLYLARPGRQPPQRRRRRAPRS